MINSVLRGLTAAALCVLPATVATPAHAAETLPLTEAVAVLPVDTESRDGYDRNKFRHWNTGDNPADGCNTRAEVLLHEAVDPPSMTMSQASRVERRCHGFWRRELVGCPGT